MRRLAGDVHIPDPMDAPSIRWGIIGASGIARTMCTAINSYTTSRVVAVAAREPSRAKAFARDNDVERAVDSYEELVACDDVDAVYVSTIHPYHARCALMALRAGKPVLVEKPFTMTAQQARDVFDAAERAHLFAMEAMWMRHLPHHHVLRAILAGGGLGAVHSVHADHGQRLLDVPRLIRPALGGGAVLDLGVYSLSFVHQALGAPEELSAHGRMRPDHLDTAEVVTVRAGDALGVARAAMDARSATAAEVVCAGGCLELPEQFYQPGILQLRTWDDEGTEVVEQWDARIPGGFQYEAAEVARCLAQGHTQSSVMPWRTTVEVMDMIDQVRAQLDIRHPGING